LGRAHSERRIDGFEPLPWLVGGHLETIVPGIWVSPGVPGDHERVVIRVSPEASVVVLVHRPETRARGTMLLVHGMGGSADSGYVCRTATRAIEEGWVVVRMNCRNCGGTAALSRTLYNAGQSDDIGAVLEALATGGLPRPLVAVGFSLGGNLVLRYAGLAGSGSLADAVAAVNPPLDLAACSRALERPANRLYQLNFTMKLCREIERIRRIRPVPGPKAVWWRIRTVRNLDRLFTAPDAGHPSAEAYYETASSGPTLAGLRVPTLMLSAANDPMIPLDTFAPYRAAAGGRITFVHPQRGGHVGYWQRGRPRFWASEPILSWLTQKGTSP
jgi:predicted alpha/beta-fold hydrolase